MPQPSKRRLQEIDDTIEQLTETLKQYNGYSSKSDLECSLMTAKLKREKLKALAAAAQSQIILAEMDVLIAETDLYSDIQRLKNCKKIKLDDRGKEKTSSCGCKSSKSTSKPVRKTQNTATKDVNSNHEKGPAINDDTASNDTVLVMPVNLNNTESIIDSSQSILSTALSDMSKRSTNSEGSMDSKESTDFFSQQDKDLIKQYDALLSNSVYAEFNTPYSKSNTYTPDLKPKKHKTGNSKTRSNKSKTKENELKNSTSNSIQKNKASECKRLRVEPDVTAMAPVRHNMPLVVTQPKIRQTNDTPCTSRPAMYLGRPMFDVQPLYRSDFTVQK